MSNAVIRVTLEKQELDLKIRKLEEFIAQDPIFLSLPISHQALLRKQRRLMSQYSEILKERLNLMK